MASLPLVFESYDAGCASIKTPGSALLAETRLTLGGVTVGQELTVLRDVRWAGTVTVTAAASCEPVVPVMPCGSPLPEACDVGPQNDDLGCQVGGSTGALPGAAIAVGLGLGLRRRVRTATSTTRAVTRG